MTSLHTHQPHAGPSSLRSTHHTDQLADLPPLAALQTWSLRPQAATKCLISDVYDMVAVIPAEPSWSAREIFLLDRWPCRMVNLVAWVAGVDHKETTMVVTLDDGDGRSVLPVTVKLPLVTVPSGRSKGTANPSPSLTASTVSQSVDTTRNSTFLTAKERKALRRAAALEDASQAKAKGKGKEKFPPIKAYQRKDVQVGDVVRVVGRLDEWYRRNTHSVGLEGGGGEWVRSVVVDEGAGGSIAVVDPDDQFDHVRDVLHLRRTVYSRPFQIPSTNIPNTAIAQSLPTPSSSRKSLPETQMSSFIEPSSAIYSEMSVDMDELRLCDPSRLRTSQLTDRTFKTYLQDHLIQSTLQSLREIESHGADAVREALEDVFPEFKEINHSRHNTRYGYTPRDNTRTPRAEVFGNSSRANVMDTDDATPTRGRSHSSFRSTTFPSMKMSPSSTCPIDRSRRSGSDTFPEQHSSTHSALHPDPARLIPFTLTSLTSTPHLLTLARLVVDATARKEEKRRRQRIRDGTPSARDLEIERARKKGKRWELSGAERERMVARLMGWGVRSIAEEGGLVQVRLRVHRGRDGTQSLRDYLTLDEEEAQGGKRTMGCPASVYGGKVFDPAHLVNCSGPFDESASGEDFSTPKSRSSRLYSHDLAQEGEQDRSEQHAYLPLPPPLLFPLLIPHIQAELDYRAKIFVKKDDPRKINGVMVEEVLARLRRWGEEGRWERVQGWVVEEGLEWGCMKGKVEKRGRGWEVV